MNYDPKNMMRSRIFNLASNANNLARTMEQQRAQRLFGVEQYTVRDMMEDICSFSEEQFVEFISELNVYDQIYVGQIFEEVFNHADMLIEFEAYDDSEIHLAEEYYEEMLNIEGNPGTMFILEASGKPLKKGYAMGRDGKPVKRGFKNWILGRYTPDRKEIEKKTEDFLNTPINKKNIKKAAKAVGKGLKKAAIGTAKGVGKVALGTAKIAGKGVLGAAKLAGKGAYKAGKGLFGALKKGFDFIRGKKSSPTPTGGKGGAPTPAPTPTGGKGGSKTRPAPTPTGGKGGSKTRPAPTPTGGKGGSKTRPAPTPTGGKGGSKTRPAPTPTGGKGGAPAPVPTPKPTPTGGKGGAPAPAPTGGKGGAPAPAPAPAPTPTGGKGGSKTRPAPTPTGGKGGAPAPVPTPKPTPTGGKDSSTTKPAAGDEGGSAPKPRQKPKSKSTGAMTTAPLKYDI